MTDPPTSAQPSVGRVLLVDDEPDQVALLRAMLTPLGMDVVTADSAEQALSVFRRHPVDVVVTDLHLPGASGIDLIRDLRQVETPPAAVLITAEGSVASAVEALKLGASDYLQKPVDPMRLVTLLQELLRSDDVREVGDNEHLPSRPTVFEGMVGGSARMREVFARIERVAPTGAPVLIVGESGTGKELVARGLHNRSRRSQGPFVPIHTGAIPKELVASELFGHEKGAFTGALSSSEGKFEAASGGTIFLDEVGTMDLSTQISLLRVLETYRFTRVGANKERDADVRIIAATNRDLLDLVEANQFREDLYYRLNVFTIAIPPLMEQTAVFAQREVVHADEIQFISTRLPTHQRGARPEALVERAPTSPGYAPAPAVPLTDMPPAESDPDSDTPPPMPEMASVSSAQPAPPSSLGVGTAEGAASASSPTSSHASSAPPPAAVSTADAEHPLVLRIPVGTPLAEAERLLIIKTLEVSDGNKQRAARILGISRRGLYTKLAAYGEHVPADEANENGVNDTPT